MFVGGVAGLSMGAGNSWIAVEGEHRTSVGASRLASLLD